MLENKLLGRAMMRREKRQWWTMCCRKKIMAEVVFSAISLMLGVGQIYSNLFSIFSFDAILYLYLLLSVFFLFLDHSQILLHLILHLTVHLLIFFLIPITSACKQSQIIFAIILHNHIFLRFCRGAALAISFFSIS